MHESSEVISKSVQADDDLSLMQTPSTPMKTRHSCDLSPTMKKREQCVGLRLCLEEVYSWRHDH